MRRYKYTTDLITEIKEKFPHVPGLAEMLTRGDSYATTLAQLRVYVGDRDILELNPGDPATVTALQKTVERNKMIDHFIEQLELVPRWSDEGPPCEKCAQTIMFMIGADGKQLCQSCGHDQ